MVDFEAIAMIVHKRKSFWSQAFRKSSWSAATGNEE